MNRREFVKGSLALAGAAAFFNVGCAKESADGKETSKEGTRKMDKKCMVIYYSWSGNTRFAAETIAKKAGAPTFEIKAETPYNSNFNKCCDEAKPECYGKTLRPIKAIEGLDLAKYDVVFVGSPNWWGTLAPPVRTWLTQNAAALKGKTVCLFQTHGGATRRRFCHPRPSADRRSSPASRRSRILPTRGLQASEVSRKVREVR